MKLRGTFLCGLAAGLAIGIGVSLTDGLTRPGLAQDTPGLAPLPVVPATPEPPVAAGQNIQQLLDRLESVRSQKAELDKQEQQLVVLIREKLQEHKRSLAELEQKLQRLGILPEHPPVTPPVAAESPLATTPRLVAPPSAPDKN